MMNMITHGVMEAAGIFWPAAHTDPRMMADLSAAAYDTRCFENYGLPFCMTVEVESMGAKIDMGSAAREPHVVTYAIESVSGWKTLPSIDHERGRARTVLEAIRLLRRKERNVPIIGNLTGPISAASSLMEPTVYYKELRKNKQDARAFMDFISDQILAFGLKQLEAGADVIAISDPSGTGEILGPDLFAQYAVPALNRITHGLKSAFPEAGIIVHICGKMHNVFEPLADVFCEALSFDAVVSIKEAREKLPGKSIMGNVSTFALELATPEKVAALTRMCMENGVNIVAPACGMGTGSPLPNVQAILKTVKS
jgi:[methyl-Co(III) methanol-specific corrinoid protein]:coenzyme M methyltransferase